MNFGDSSADLQLRVWIDDARKRMHTITYITDRVKTAFDEQGIEIPYPKRDIYIFLYFTLRRYIKFTPISDKHQYPIPSTQYHLIEYRSV